MNGLSERLWYLELKNKALQNQLACFKSGNAYTKLRKEYESVIHEKDRSIRELESELSKAHAQIIDNRNHWFEVSADMEKEAEQAMKRKDKEIERLEKRAFKAEKQRDDALDRVGEWRSRYYELSAKTEGLEGLVKKLKAQVNKDFENSSIPSSGQGAGRKKIPNTRTKTGRRRGGQAGHEGHRLTQRKATEKHHLPDPEAFINDPSYYATGETVKRQKIVLKLGIEIIEYEATVFRNKETGSRVHAEFPDGFYTDICYDSSVKAFAFLLANDGNMSAGKIKNVLFEATGGKLNLSEATINGLCREFSLKSKKERDEIIRNIMESPAMNIDFTNANVNGESKQVLIIASPNADACLFMARDTKGHKGVCGTPVENYVGTLIHDHDTTFYSYGMKHQECMQHNLRYLTGSAENEPERKWNQQMHGLLQEMIHYKKGLGGKEAETEIVEAFEKRYDKILETAKKEYEDDPPNDYYREGYNLYLRLVKYKESELLFLHDKYIPADNSLAERLARQYKRKQKQAIVMRSDENFTCICDSLSVINTYRKEEGNFYHKVIDIFERPRPKRNPVALYENKADAVH